MRPLAAALATLAIRCRPIPLLLVLCSLPLSAAAVRRVDGDAFDGDSGALRYRESHWLLDDGARLVLYRCPDGRPFARKQVDGGGTSPDFSLIDGRDGYREGVRHRDGVREMFQLAPGKPERRTTLPPGAGARVIDAGFDTYLRAQWDAIASAPQKVDFVLPSLQRQLRFRVERMGDAAGQRRFRISLDAGTPRQCRRWRCVIRSPTNACSNSGASVICAMRMAAIRTCASYSLTPLRARPVPRNYARHASSR